MSTTPPPTPAEEILDAEPSRSRVLHLVTFAVFALALVFPWVAGALGASADTVERRRPTEWPDIDRTALGDVETFATLNDYVRDHTPLRGPMAARWNGLWLTLDASADTTVVEGPGDVMFLAEDFTNPCERNYELEALRAQFGEYSAAADAGGKDWLFLIAPDKGAVLDYRLEGRAEQAAACSRVERATYRETLDSTGVSFDLAPILIAADQRTPGEWYYPHDSHWTFAGGDLVAQRIVDHFEPELFDLNAVTDIDRSLPIRGDIYGRMGILRLRETPDPVHSSERAEVVTERTEEQIGGTRTIRTYRNTGAGETIPGSTLIIHDSMMNFAERQLAAYFDEAVFVHWDDLNRAGFFERVATSDRVIMMRVERAVHSTVGSTLLRASFADDFVAALSTPALRPDPDLGPEFIDAAAALRTFVQDTGAFPNAFADLLTDPGIDGWGGPYLDRAVFASGEHPRYGSWGIASESTVTDPAVLDCATIHSPPCRPFISLTGVPRATALALSNEIDGIDGGLLGGIVRWTSDEATAFYYPFG